MGSDMSNSTRPGQVIVGASASGVSAALAMRRSGYDGAITLIDSDANQPYERPPLSKSVLGTAVPLKDIVPASDYTDHDIDLRTGVQVERLDTENSAVLLNGGESLRAERVLLATGVAARRLDVPGADLEHVLVLRDAADAAVLARRLIDGGPLVIIGGGFIGLELAALGREHQIDVTVVELAQLPLIGVVGREIAELTHRLHVDRGVRFILNSTVLKFEGDTAVEAVQLVDGRVLPAATVVVGVGVMPRDRLARNAGISVDSAGIVIDDYGATSNPWISATGDVASQLHPRLENRGRIEHWDVAMGHGASVGATLAGRPTRYDAVPYAWSDQFGMTIQMLGRMRQTDEFVLRHGSRPDKFIAFWLRTGQVGAVIGLGMARDVGAAKRLIESGLEVEASVLADPEVDLRHLYKQLAAAD
jgi:3-phenylpropionate/trans-cinnamate dioxygenase ferredoxin reductase component